MEEIGILVRLEGQEEFINGLAGMIDSLGGVEEATLSAAESMAEMATATGSLEDLQAEYENVADTLADFVAATEEELDALGGLAVALGEGSAASEELGGSLGIIVASMEEDAVAAEEFSGAMGILVASLEETTTAAGELPPALEEVSRTAQEVAQETAAWASTWASTWEDLQRANLNDYVDQVREAGDSTQRAGEAARVGGDGFNASALGLQALQMAGLGFLAGGAMEAITGAFRKVKSELTSYVSESIRYGSMLEDLHATTGASVEDLSRLEYMFNQVGLSLQNQQFAMRTFANNMQAIKAAADAGKEPSGGFAKALDQIGVSAFNADGSMRNFADMLPDIAAGLQTLPLGPERMAAAFDLLGRGAMGMIDILGMTKAEMQAYMDEAEQMGMVMSLHTAEAAEKLEFNMTQLGQKFRAVKIAVGNELIPELNNLFDVLNSLAKGEAWDLELKLKASDVATGHLATTLLGVLVPGLTTVNDVANQAVDSMLAWQENVQALGSGFAELIPSIGQTTESENALFGSLIDVTQAVLGQQNAQQLLAGGLSQTEVATILYQRALAQSGDAALTATQKVILYAQAVMQANAAAEAGALAQLGAFTQAEQFIGQFTDAGVKAFQSVGGAGVSAADQIEKRMATMEISRIEDARRAALEIGYWYQDQNEFIGDNAALMTEELKAEFAARTEAARLNADAVKETNAQLALQLLSMESQYQQQKLAIATDPNLSDEERAAALANLDRENAEAIQRVQERAALEAQIAQERWDREVEMMRTAGAAGGQAMAEAFALSLPQMIAGIEQLFATTDKWVQEGASISEAQIIKITGFVQDAQQIILDSDMTGPMKEAAMASLQTIAERLLIVGDAATTAAGQASQDWLKSLAEVGQGMTALERANYTIHLNKEQLNGAKQDAADLNSTLVEVDESKVTVNVQWTDLANADTEAEDLARRMQELDDAEYELNIIIPDIPQWAQPASPKTQLQARLEMLDRWVNSHPIQVQVDAAGNGLQWLTPVGPITPGPGEPGAGFGGPAWLGDFMDQARETGMELGDLAAGFGRAGGAFAGMYQDQWGDRITELQDQLAALAEEESAIEYLFSMGGVDVRGAVDLQRRLLQIEQARAEAQAELTDRAEEMLALQERQQQLDFLQQQMDLLALIEQAGLNPEDILGPDFEWGLGADLEALMGALATAMEAIIAQMNQQLAPVLPTPPDLGLPPVPPAPPIGPGMGYGDPGDLTTPYLPLPAPPGTLPPADPGDGTTPFIPPDQRGQSMPGVFPLRMLAGMMAPARNGPLVNIGPVTIMDSMDMAVFEARVERVVERAIDGW